MSKAMSGQIPILKRTMPALREAIRSFVLGTEGAAAVEFTLFAPTLVGMVVCTMDLGVGMYRQMQVQHAAQAGIQYVIAHGYNPSDISPISSAVTQATTFAGISASPAPNQFCGCRSSTGVTSTTCTSTCDDGSLAATYVTVSAQATYMTIVPYPLISNSFPLTAQATVRR
jgi:Flp pilus assembly protein TadG